MHSTFTGIEMGKRSLNAHSEALTTVGHNLTNSATEGYSRQRVTLSPYEPLYSPQLNRPQRPGQIGQGVDSITINRIRDELLEGRILAQRDDGEFWKTRSDYILMVEQIYNEPNDVSVRVLMDRFWEGWQDLSLSPESMAPRQAILARGKALIEGINHQYSRLKATRTMLNEHLKVAVGEVNTLLADISRLNEEILKSKALGDHPNDLLDRRDLLVDKLSAYIDIQVDHRDSDEFLVHTKGRHLVQGSAIFPLQLEGNPLNEGYWDVSWEKGGDPIVLDRGKLGALVGLRDRDLREEIQKLDAMTIHFTDLTNEIHRRAYSTNETTGLDFFVEYPFVDNNEGNYDLDGDGLYDHSYLFRITGSQVLSPERQLGFAGEMTLSGRDGPVTIPYVSTDTIGEVIDRINHSQAEVVARLDREGHLSLKGTEASQPTNPDFVIRYLADSGYFLTSYTGLLQQQGEEGALSWDVPNAIDALRTGEANFSAAPLTHPSGWIQMNPKVLADPSVIVSGFGKDGKPSSPGNGDAAAAMAQLRNQPVLIGEMTFFDDYFANTVADIGLQGEIASQTNDSQQAILRDLETLRSSRSGVSIDEEMAEMIKFQHGYNAAARFVTQVDQMLDTIINRMGVA